MLPSLLLYIVCSIHNTWVFIINIWYVSYELYNVKNTINIWQQYLQINQNGITSYIYMFDDIVKL